MATIVESVTMLFGAFGQTKDRDRIAIYTKALGAALPPALVEKAILKTLAEWTLVSVPPVGVIIKNAQSIHYSVNDFVRVKSWDEAWAEIDSAMRHTPWGKTPVFSTPQITEAVRSFGWDALQRSLEADMPIVRAQIRKNYESVCQRMEERAHNEFILGSNPLGVLGIGKDMLSLGGGVNAEKQ